MAELITSLVTFTAKSVVKKTRKVAAKRLSNGDVVDQGIANTIIPDDERIKKDLKAIKRTNLQASISFYNEGVESLAFDAVDSPPPNKRRKIAIDDSLPTRKEDIATFSQANSKLSPDSKKRFEDARKQAVLAISNTALETKDIVLAVYIKIMAQLLEGADDPTRALLFCKGYLEDMHGMKTIIANIATELKEKSPKKHLKKVDRRRIISYVCHVNRVIFDIAQSFGGDRVFQDLFLWPTIKIKGKGNGKVSIDVLRDPRIDKVLSEQGLETISVVRSFGDQNEEQDHKLRRPQGITANTKGEFVVLDDTDIKIYNSSGGFLHCLPKDRKFGFHTVDVDTDKDGSLYLLAWKTSKDHGKNTEKLFEVFVFDTDGEFRNKFSLRSKCKGHKLALNSHGNHTEVLVLEGGQTGLHDEVGVYRYETEGAFDRQFGNGILRDAKDVVSATDGRILVLDESRESKKKSRFHIFDAGKRHICSFDVEIFQCPVAMALHRASGHVVVIFVSKDRKELFWSINNANSDCRVERSYKRTEAGIQSADITVTPKGRIAIAVSTQRYDGRPKGKVIVL